MTETATSFDVLADGLKASDHDAYAALFKLMHEPLLRYTFRIAKDEALCLDILQDVFMKLWEKRHQLEVRISLKALLYTMARNQALNALRGTGKTIEISQLDCAQLYTETPGEENKLAAKQLDAYFKSWITELPPRRAEAFILSRHHGLSHLEISNVMGLSKRTIDTHINHALRFLRERFDKLQKRGMES